MIPAIPYFASHGITLYCGSWQDILPSLALKADCIVTDPPYGDTALIWDRSDTAWLSGVTASVHSNGSVWTFGSLKYLSRLMRDNTSDEWRLAQDLIWEKQNGSGFAVDRFKRVHELIAQFWHYSTPWADVYKQPLFTLDGTARTIRRKRRPPHMGNVGAGAYSSYDGGPRLVTSVLYEPNCHGTAIHPTQKPLGILRALIDYSCPPGGLVLDVFAGSCSTLLAAHASGREAIGIEISEEYCAASAQRLRAALQQLPLTHEVSA